jgi:hypothetical protein
VEDRKGYWLRVMERYEKHQEEQAAKEKREAQRDQMYGKGRGIRFKTLNTCACGGDLIRVQGKKDVWHCAKCGKTVVTASFETYGKMCNLVYAGEKEILNLDGAIVKGGGSKSCQRRKKKPREKVGSNLLQV